MTLYDKKYVYFEWDDKLEGKEVILARTINDIKEFVNSGDKGRFFIVHKGNDLPFSNGTVDCEFCYYDPYYKFRKAYIEGKQLQFKDPDNGRWEDVIGAPSFACDEYRIKPDNYVPFDTVQELIDAWEKKSGVKFNHELAMPLIWIKRKQKNRVYLITDFLFEKWCNCDVGTEDEDLKLTELFNDFTFLDGSIIGKRS